MSKLKACISSGNIKWPYPIGPGKLLGKRIWQKSKDTQRRQWHPTPVLLPRKSHGWRSLLGCHPWGREESDTTERLHFHFSLSCIGEGNGNPLQCSCLKNPRDGRAWWTAVYGVSQSRTRLMQLSSSSSKGYKLKAKFSSTLCIMIFSTKQGMLDMQVLCTFIEQSLYSVGCWHKQESYSSEFKSIRRK